MDISCRRIPATTIPPPAMEQPIARKVIVGVQARHRHGEDEVQLAHERPGLGHIQVDLVRMNATPVQQFIGHPIPYSTDNRALIEQ